MVGVAQLVRAPDCGSGGRGFETRHPPHAPADQIFADDGFIDLWTRLDQRTTLRLSEIIQVAPLAEAGRMDLPYVEGGLESRSDVQVFLRPLV